MTPAKHSEINDQRGTISATLISSMGDDLHAIAIAMACKDQRVAKAARRAFEKKPEFLKSLSIHGQIRISSRLSCVSVHTVQGWMKKDSNFRREVNEQLQQWKGVDAHKKCCDCLQLKLKDEFHARSDRPQMRSQCKECYRAAHKISYEKHKREKFFLWKSTRTRSRSQFLKVPFNLTPEYLREIWTGTCPVFRINLSYDTDRESEESPELDKIVPELGYVIGNVAWMSRKANRVKNNMSIDDVRKLLCWLESATTSPVLERSS